jgi:hypothetical protein
MMNIFTGGTGYHQNTDILDIGYIITMGLTQHLDFGSSTGIGEGKKNG